MNRIIQTIGAAALLAATAIPALAQIDAGALTCGDWVGMDTAGKLEATNAITNFVNDVTNSEIASLAATSIKGLPIEEVNKVIDSSCMDKDVTMTVVSAMK